MLGNCRDEASIAADMECSLTPLSCTGTTCVDHNFNVYHSCHDVTVNGGSKIRCHTTFPNNTQTCVYKAAIARPQENP